jgi:hypothetical protein
MSSSRRGVLTANGFGRGSLTLAEAHTLYDTRYHVLSNMRLPSNDGWEMAVNGIGIPPAPMPGTYRWPEEIWLHRCSLSPAKRAYPT